MNEMAVPIIAAAVAVPLSIVGWQYSRPDATEVPAGVGAETVAAAEQPDLTYSVESLKENMFGHVTVVVRIKNHSERSYQMVFAECAFLDSKKVARDTGLAIVNNLGPGDSGYGQATVIDGKPVKSVTCRISQAM